MGQDQQVRHKVTTHVLLFVLSVLLISTTVIVGVLSYSSITKLQDQQTTLQQKYDALYSQYANLLSNYSAQNVSHSDLLSLYANLQSQYANLTSDYSSLQIEHTSLQSQYASLMENYSKLLTDYQQAVNNYLTTMPLVTDSSYYIFKQNDTYYAKSGLTGEIEYHDTNCSSVINYALAHVPYGGAVFFKPLASADDAYYVDSTIYPPNGTTLASENRMVTISLDNNSAVQAVIDLYDVHDVQISNVRIDGNEGNNASCNGIIIDSNSSYASNHLIENVVIDDCNLTGLLIQHYPLNNVVRNVKVFHSGSGNVEVHSADNKLISVESGWAGLSGFEVLDVDNYFLNCISYGCGQMVDNDGNGFLIKGARNMFVGCDAGANFQGGFVLDNAIQTMLESCVARDNGQTNSHTRIPGRWGFDLYNSNSTILSGCLSTDENDTYKTQDYGFTEGGNCDYNTVTGCNFDGNRVGAVFDLVGIHSVITDTIGYETKNLGYTNFRSPLPGEPAAAIDVSTNNTYGTPKNFTSETGTIVDFHVTIQWDNVSLNENVTVMAQALLENGTTTSLEISKNTNSTYILTQEDLSELWSNNTTIQEILISAKTTGNTTLAKVHVFVWGSGG
jgi:Skp family chaperone for outer membrane proteins